MPIFKVKMMEKQPVPAYDLSCTYAVSIINSKPRTEGLCDCIRVLVRERASLLRRLIELEEVKMREDGSAYWTSSGENI